MSIYRKFKIEELTLRDYLALERTIMSNERTLLAYLRTGIALLIAGIAGTHILPQKSWLIISLSAVVAGLIVVGLGVQRFLVVRSRLNDASPDATADITATNVSQSVSPADKNEHH